MATFNGLDLFGPVCTVNTVQAPQRRQVNRYPGISGLQVLDLGGDGGVSVIEGLLVAVDVASLYAVENIARGQQARRISATFVDNYGVAWNDCLLDQFEPVGRVMAFTGIGVVYGVSRAFRATVLHLS